MDSVVGRANNHELRLYNYELPTFYRTIPPIDDVPEQSLHDGKSQIIQTTYRG